MSWVSVAVGVGGALLASNSAGDAADASAAGAKQASATQKAMYDQTRGDLTPYRDAGPVALSELMHRLGLGGQYANARRGEAPTRAQFTTQGAQGAVQGANGFGGYSPIGSDQTGVKYANKANPTGNINEQDYMTQLLRGGGMGGQSNFDQAGFDQATSAWNAQGQGGQGGMGQDGGDPSTKGSLLHPFGLEDFQQSPAYQFNLEQGMTAIGKQAAARGKYYAPATLQDLGKFTQGTASNEFQNAYGNYNNNQQNVWNRLSGVAGIGQSAANQTGAYGNNMASQVGGYQQNAGNAQAAGIMGQNSALQGGLQNGLNAYQTYLSNQQSPTYSNNM